jgi:hypothetical protein
VTHTALRTDELVNAAEQRRNRRVPLWGTAAEQYDIINIENPSARELPSVGGQREGIRRSHQGSEKDVGLPVPFALH